MNDMEPLEFKKFMNLLAPPRLAILSRCDRHDPPFRHRLLLVRSASLNGWFAAGIGHLDDRGSITKITNTAHLQLLGKPEKPTWRLPRSDACVGRNAFGAWITLLSVIPWACQFSVEGTVVALRHAPFIAYPSLWLGANMPTSQ